MLNNSQIMKLNALKRLVEENRDIDTIREVIRKMNMGASEKVARKSIVKNDIESKLYELKLYGYTDSQLKVIRVALERDLPIDDLLCIDKDPEELDLILKGLINGYDVSLYKDNLSIDQMREIVVGLRMGLNVSLIAKPYYSAEKMSLYIKALRKNFSIYEHLDRNLSVEELKTRLSDLRYKNTDTNIKVDENSEESLISNKDLSYMEMLERF